MKVCVTGANGFLGAWLTKRLLDEGHSVTALVRQNSDLSELSTAKPNYSYGDVTDLNSLQLAFKNQDVVFHLAGVVAYKKSDRALMNRVNVDGTKNVVTACTDLHVPQLLHVSSVVAIGSSFTQQVLNEESPYEIQNLDLGYFETKREAEKVVIAAAQEKKLHAICVNPSTIYGFGDARKGSRKNQIKVAQGKLPIYTAGGVNVVGVEDVVDGILLALNKGRNAERYILASENLTIKKLFNTIAEAAGVAAPKYYMPTWALHTLGFLGDHLEPYGINLGVSQVNAYTASMFHWFSAEKARKELGFSPRPSELAIEKSVRWMKDNGYLK